MSSSSPFDVDRVLFEQFARQKGCQVGRSNWNSNVYWHQRTQLLWETWEAKELADNFPRTFELTYPVLSNEKS